MKPKRVLVLVLAMCLSLALCACGKQQTPGAGVSPGSGPQTTQGGDTTTDPTQPPAGGSVDFGLQTAPDPDFDSPATGDDSGKLYTIVGDYAYELDPATLQPIGEPLDPVTHQPVSNPVLDGENPSTPNNPQNDTPVEPPVAPPPADPEPVVEPTTEPVVENTEPPAPEVSLPNTGMFLEDD